MTTSLTQRVLSVVVLFLFAACSSPSNNNETTNHETSRADSPTTETTSTNASTNVSTVQGRVLDVVDFSEVSVSSGMHVEIRQGDGFHVAVDGSDEALEKLKFEQDGDELRFFFDDGVLDRLWQSEDHSVNISIQMPELTDLDLSSGARGDILMETPSSPFEADLSSGAELEGNMSARSIALDLSSGSEVTMGGETGKLTLEGSSGSRFDLAGLSADEVVAELSSGATAHVTTDGVINADLSSGGTVTYEGNPRMGDIETSSGGTIRRAE